MVSQPRAGRLGLELGWPADTRAQGRVEQPGPHWEAHRGNRRHENTKARQQQRSSVSVQTGRTSVWMDDDLGEECLK